MEDRLRTTGWLYLLLLPLLALGLFGELAGKHADSVSLVFFEVLLSIAFLVVQLYIFQSWKSMLNGCYGFNSADELLSALIALTYVVAGLRVLDALFTSASPTLVHFAYLGTGYLRAAVALGFAIRLLRLDDALDGYRKTYCFLAIASNTCILTILLIPLGALAKIAEIVVAAMLFFSLANRVPERSDPSLRTHLP